MKTQYWKRKVWQVRQIFSWSQFIKRDDSRIEVLIVRVGRQARVFHCQQRKPLVAGRDVFECWWKTCKTGPRQLTEDLLAVINGFVAPVDVPAVAEWKLTTHPLNRSFAPTSSDSFQKSTRKLSSQVFPLRISGVNIFYDQFYTQIIIYINNDFFSAVYRKIALSVSFCVRKVDFPALVRENFKCAKN